MTPGLRTATVLGIAEEACEVWDAGGTVTVAFAPMFPRPRVERVSPGHLVAVASTGAREAVVWRWFDAVVLGADDRGVRLWEPAHGEVVAAPRPSYVAATPGSRAFASAGLPGADWWVEGPAVDLAAVEALYAENDLWPRVFPS